MNDLIEIIHRIARRALAAFEGPPVSGDDVTWTTNLRAAFVEAADSGELADWDVKDGAELRSLDYRAGIDERGNLLVVSSENIANHIHMIEFVCTGAHPSDDPWRNLSV